MCGCGLRPRVATGMTRSSMVRVPRRRAVPPYSWAVIGAVLGAGASGRFSSSPDAVFLIGPRWSCSFTWAVRPPAGSGTPSASAPTRTAGILAARRGAPPGHVPGPREVCLLFQQRADRIAVHDEQLRAEARDFRIRACWHSRPHRAGSRLRMGRRRAVERHARSSECTAGAAHLAVDDPDLIVAAPEASKSRPPP
jgi:hypothetical protein